MIGGDFQALSELQNRFDRLRARLLGRTALCGAVTFGVLFGSGGRDAEAGPEGTTVTHGSVAIQKSGTHTEFTQSTNKAILTHKSFDIKRNESVHFAQPSKNALAVNKVIGKDLPTNIAGKLTANGNVWVINPSGVAISSTAQVNVNGLIATTASISDQDILSGKTSFAGAPAGSAVTNAGEISAGDGSVVLVAPVVENSGTITTQGSDIALGAGSGFTVDFDGDGLTRFEVAPASGVSLTNTGAISAEGGAAYISAESADAVQTAVVSIGGKVEATRIEEKGGVIVISGGDQGVTEVTGEIDASQATGDGGAIAIAGDKIAIRETAEIDASGAASGGTIEIGGALRGAPIQSDVVRRASAPADAPLPTAKRVLVERGAVIAANAADEGDGGTIALWSDEYTVFYGALEAKGGFLSGDGGFAEVSGKIGVEFLGSADLSAPVGENGTFLIDPDTIFIVNAGNGDVDDEALLDDDQILFAEAPGEALSIGAQLITGADIVLEAETLIQINDPIDSDSSLTLRSNGDITTTDVIDVAGDLTIIADADGVGGGTFSITDATDDLIAANVVIETGEAVTLGDITTGSLTVTAGGEIVQLATTSISATGTATLTTGTAAITLTEAGNDVGLLRITSAGEVAFVDSNAIGLDIENAGNTTITATDVDITNVDITDNRLALISLGGVVDVGVGVGGATFVLADAEIPLITAGELSITSGDQQIQIGFDFTGAGNATFDGIDLVTFDAGTEDVIIQQDSTFTNLTSTSDVFQTNNNDDLIVSGTASITATTNAVIQDTVTVGTLILEAGSDVSTDPDSLLTIETSGSISAGGNITFDDDVVGLDPNGIVTVDLDIDAGGNLVFDDNNDVLDLTGTGDFTIGGNLEAGEVDVAALTLDVVGDADFQTTVTVTGDLGISVGDDVRFRDDTTIGGTLSVTQQADGDIEVFADTVDGSGTQIDFDDLANTSIGTLTATTAVDGAISTADATVNGITAIALTSGTGGVTVDGLNHTAAGGSLTIDAGTGAASFADSASSLNNLTVTASDSITQAVSITVLGAADLTATNAITFDNTSNDFNTVAANGAAVTLVDDNNITIAAVTAADLNVTSANSSIVTTDGTDIAIANGDVEFTATSGAIQTGGDISVTDGNVTLTAEEGLTLGGDIVTNNTAGSTITGNIELISDASGLDADGGVNDIVFDGDVTINAASDLTFASGDGAINDGTGGTAALLVGGSIVLPSITFTDSDLSVTAGGSITQETGSAISIAGSTSLVAGDVITLDDAFNDFDSDDSGDGVSALAGSGSSAVSLRDVDAIVLGSVTGSALTVVANGSITDTDGSAISVSGTTSLLASDESPDSGGLTEFHDIQLNNNSVTGGQHTLTALIATGEDIEVEVSGALDLAGITTNGPSDRTADGLIAGNAGDLIVTAGGALTDSAPVTVAGDTSISAAGQSVTLDDGANEFGTLDVTVEDLTVVEADATDLGAITLTGNLAVTTTAGDITDAAGSTVSVTGTTSLTAQAADSAIDVNNVGGGAAVHTFTGTTSLSAGEIANFSAASALSLGTVTTTAGDAANTITSEGAGGITLTGAVNVGAGAADRADLALIASGNVTQETGGTVVADVLTLTASEADLSVNLATDAADAAVANDVNRLEMSAGSETLTALSFNDAGGNGVDLGLISTGTLSVTADGEITDSGVITATGAASFTATGFNITLDGTSNDFGAAVDAEGANIVLTDENAIELGDIDAVDNGTVTGDLSVIAGTTISDGAESVVTDGDINVDGLTTLTAGIGEDIDVGDQTNDFGGEVTILSAGGGDGVGNVTIGDANTLSVSAIDVADTVDDGDGVFDRVTVRVGDAITFNDTTDTLLLTIEEIGGDGIDFGDAGGSRVNVAAGVASTSTLTTSGAALVLVTDGDIAVDNVASDLSGAVTLDAGGSVAFQDNNSDTTLDSSFVGDLVVVGDAGISQAGASLSVGGTTDLDAVNGVVRQTIDLGLATNDFTGSVDATGGAVTLGNANAITLAGVSADSLSITTSSGSIGQNAGSTVVVSGATTLSAGGVSNIVLDQSGNDFGSDTTLAIADRDVDASGVDITLTDANDLVLGDIDASGTLTVTALGTGTISDDGVSAADADVNVAGVTSLTAGGDITLDDAFNDFDSDDSGDGVSALAGSGSSAVSLRDVDAIVLGSVTGSALTVVANGSITDTDGSAISVSGTTSLLASDESPDSGGLTEFHDIQLNNNSVTGGQHTLTALIATGEDIEVEVSGALDLAGITTNGPSDRTADGLIAGNAGDLIVTAGGALTDSAPVTVAGDTSISAAGQSVTLDDGANEFGTLDVTVEDLTVVEADATDLGAITLTGNLAVTTTAGDITDAAGSTVSVTGTTSLTAQAADSAIDVNNVGGGAAVHTFTGTTSLSAGEIANFSAASALSLGTVTTTAGDAANTITSEGAGGITLTGAVNVGAGAADRADLALIASGNVTQETGGTVVADVLTLTASEADLSVNLATDAADAAVANDVNRLEMSAGSETLTALSFNDAGGNGVDLGLISTGTLSVTADGEITDSGVITATGAASFTATGFNITLDGTSNDFGAAVDAEGANIVLTDENAIELGDIDAVDNGTVTGDLSVIAGTTISDGAESVVTDGDINVDGLTTLTAGIGEDIDVGDQTNDFGGEVTILSAGGGDGVGNVTIGDANTLSVSAIDVADTVDDGDGVFDRVTVRVGDAITFNDTTDTLLLTIEEIGGDGIDFGDAGGSRVNVAAGVASTSTLTTSGAALVLVTDGDIAVDNVASDLSGAVTLDAGGSVAFQDNNSDTTLDSSFVGDLVVVGDAGISQAGASLSVGGTTDLDAVNGVVRQTIDLGLATNDFTGSVDATGGAVTLGNANAITLAGVSADSLSITTSSGSIGQNAGSTVVVSGATTLSAGGVSNIVLDQSGNDFGSDTTLAIADRDVDASGVDITLTDANDLVLGDIDASGTLTVTALGTGTISDDGVSAADADVNVAGVTSLTAGGDITLDDAFNDFDSDDSGDGVSALAGSGSSAVSLRDVDAIVLGSVTGSALTVVANGSITDTDGSAISVSGTTSLLASDESPDSGGLTEFHDIQLNNNSVTGGQHTLTALIATGEDIEVEVSGALDLAGITTNGPSDRTADGLIAGNAGDLIVTAGGALTDSAPVTVAGDTSISAAGQSVTLDDGANEFGTLDVTVEDLTVVEADATDLGAITLTGNLAVTTTAGDITDAAGSTVSVTGTTSLTAQAADSAIDVNNVGGGAAVHTFTGTTSLSAGEIANFSAASALSLGTVTTTAGDAANTITSEGAGGITLTGAVNVGAGAADRADLALIASGNVTQETGGTVVADVLTLTASEADLSVNLATDAADAAVANDVNRLEMSAGSETLTALSFNDAGGNGVDLGLISTGTLSVTADGEITDSGVITAGTTTLVAQDSAGTTFDITLDTDTNDFSAAVDASGLTVTLVDANDIQLGAIDAAADLDVTARNAGAISDTSGQSISVTGIATLTAGGDVTLDETDGVNAIHDLATVTASGANITLTELGGVILNDVTATGGAIDIDSTDTITVAANQTVTADLATDLNSLGGAIIGDTGSRIIGASVALRGDTVTADVVTATSADVDIDAVVAEVDLNGPVTAQTDVNIAAATTATLDDISTAQLIVTTSSGSIGQNAGSTVVVSGATTLSAGGVSNIVLDQSGNDFGSDTTLAIADRDVDASGVDITLTDANDLVLGDIDASGTLTVTALGTGTISDDGVSAADADVNVAGVTSLTAGGDITLDDAFNDFDSDDSGDGVSALAGSGSSAVSLRDVDAIVLGSVTGSALTVVANGSITDTDGSAISVSGTTSLLASDESPDSGGLTEFHDIQLNNNSVTGGQHTLTALIATGEDIEVEVSGALDLAGITTNGPSDRTADGLIAGNAGDLIVTAGGALTDSAPVTVAGDTSISAAGQSVTLDDGANEFGTLDVTVEDLTVVEADATDLGAITLTGNLAVTTTAGDITDAAGSTVSVTGTTSLTAQAADSAIDVNNVGGGAAVHTFTGTTSLSAGEIANFSAASALSLGTVTTTAGDAANTITSEGAGGITLTGAVNVGAGAADRADLALIASGNVTQETGGTVVADVLTLTASEADLSVNLATDAADAAVANDVNRLEMSAGSETLTALSFNDAGGNGVDLGLISTGTLSVTADGEITDSGVITAGTTTLVAQDSAGTTFDITLDTDTNDFSAAVDASGLTVTLVDANDIQLGAIDAAADLDVTARNAGAISDTSGQSISVTGIATLTAGGDVTLDETDGVNAIHDLATVTASGANITLTELGGVILNDVTATGGAIDIDSTDTITVAANQTVTADLATDLNSLGGAIIGDTGSRIIGASVALRGDTVTADVVTATSADVDIDAVVAEVDLNGPVTAQTDVNIAAATTATLDDISTAQLIVTTSSGSIGQNAGSTVVVSGATTLSAGGVSNIVLDQSGNDFGSDTTLAIADRDVDASGVDITLTDANDLVLGDIDASGTLTVTALGTGTISDDGVSAADADVNVAGVTSLTAGGDITLDDAFNDFATANAEAPNVTLTDANDIELGDIDAGTGLTVTALGTGSITDDGNGAFAGDDVNAGSITSLTAGGDIILDDAQTDLVILAGSAENVTLSELNGLTFDAFTASNADVTTTGAIDQNLGTAIGVSGAATLTSGIGFDITLAEAANDFGQVNASATNVTVSDQNAIELGDLDVTGNFTLSSAGAVTDAGATVSGEGINVDGVTSIIAIDSTGAEQDILLGSIYNNFDSDAGSVNDAADEIDLAGANVTIGDEDGLALGDVSVTGEFSVVAGGSITDTSGENIIVAGNTSILAAASTNAAFDILEIDLTDTAALADVDFFDIALNTAANAHDFNSVDFNGEDIAILDVNDLAIIATANADGSSDPTLNGDGALVLDVANDLSVTAIEVADTFTLNLGGSLDAGLIDAGNNLNLSVDQDINAQTLTAGNNISVTAAGNLSAGLLETDAGNLATSVTGTTDVTDIAVAGNADLSSRGDFTVTDGFVVGENVRVRTNGSLQTADVSANVIEFTADGDVTVASVLAAESVSVTSGGTMTFEQVTSTGSTIDLQALDNFSIVGSNDTPLNAESSLRLTSRNGSFTTNGEQQLRDGLTFRSRTGDIVLDFGQGFVVEDVSGPTPFTLDAERGTSVIRIDDGLFAIGSADFLDEAQSGAFNAFFGTLDIVDDLILSVTGNLALVSDGDLSVRIQNTSTAPNDGQGVLVEGTTFVGGQFTDISLFGTFNGQTDEAAALEFRDAAELGLPGFLRDNANTVNGCVILLQSSCQPIGSLTLALEFDDGSLLGITFVDPAEDEDDPFSNRGDEEEWE